MDESKNFNNFNEFHRELEQYINLQKDLIESECEGFELNPKAQKKRLNQVKKSFEFFVYTYFPHYIKHPQKSEFQEYVFSELIPKIKKNKGLREAVIAPRGESKSTIITQLLSLYFVITDNRKMIVIIMDIIEQASEMLAGIKIELEFNPRLLQDFPESTGVGSIWQFAQIVTKNNIKIKVGGATKKLRGVRHGAYRPDLVILDDLENDENVRSKEQRDKLQRWINQTVLKLGPPDGSMDCIIVGTILHYDSVLNRIHKNPIWNSRKFKAIIKYPDNMTLWEKWEEVLLNESTELALSFYRLHKKNMDKGAIVSWAKVRPLYLLMKTRAEDHNSFDSEYQNDPTNSELAVFQNIYYWSEQPIRNECIYVAAVDPSMGKTGKRSDPSAILLGAWQPKTQQLKIIAAEIVRRTPELMIERIIELHKAHNPAIWWIETIAFQEFFATQLFRIAKMKQVTVPIQGFKPITDKKLRIETLQPHINQGTIQFHISQTTLIEQIRHYPEADHDDGPDALNMLWMACQQYSVKYEYESVERANSIFATENNNDDDYN